MVDKKTHLEESLEFVVNEDLEQAVAHFHDFIVEKSRDIYESLMEDDELDETVDSEEAVEEKVKEAKVEETTEETVEEGMNEYFGEDDLEGTEMDAPEMDDAEMDDAEMGDAEMDMDAPEEEVMVPANDLLDLQAKFKEIMGGAGLDDDSEMDMDAPEMDDAEMDMGDLDVAENAFSVETNTFAESKDVNEDDKVEEEVSEAFDFDLTEEDFFDLEEGLKSVNVSMGGEQGGVKFAGEETNTKSPVADKDKSDVNADPTDGVSKQDEHGSFNRESAPSNDKLPHSEENNHDKADGTKGRSTVAGHGGLESNSGNGGEQGNEKFAGTENNTKSIIGSAGSRNEK